jgi:hypothetical protein
MTKQSRKIGCRLVLATLRILMLLSFSFVMECNAQSEQQPPTNKAPNAEQSAHHEQQDINNQSITVNDISTTEQQAIAEKEAAEAKIKAAHEEQIIAYTGDLVLVGLVQFVVFLLQLIAFIVQAIYMRKSAKEMQKTTEAAERVSNDQIAHAHQVERAYLSGGGVLGTEVVNQAIPLDYNESRNLDLTSINRPVFELAINNHGKTPGRLLAIGSNVCEGGAIPEIPDYRWKDSFDWIGPGTQSRRYGEIRIPPNLKNPIVYARFRYRDIFGDEHSCGFIQRGSESIPAPDAYTDWD